jgi:hypothetical protein
MSSVPPSDAPECDGTSVGVLISRHDHDQGPRWLVFDRPDGTGTAMVTGHGTDHGNLIDAAHDEVRYQVGLTVTSLRRVSGGWRDNRCDRPTPLGAEIGHLWSVYQATVTGVLTPSPREARAPRWVTGAQLLELADRSAAYAHGRLTPSQWIAEPGLEAVWVMWLRDADIIGMRPADLEAIEHLAELGPARCAGCGTTDDLDALGRCYDPDVDRLGWECPPCQTTTGHHPTNAHQGPAS